MANFNINTSATSSISATSSFSSSSMATKPHYRSLLEWLGIAYNSRQVKALSGIITLQEWSNKSLSKETMNTLGLKGSPKISKVLLSMGVPTDTIQQVLPPAALPSYVTAEEADCLEQGNSIYYSSCQATDPRAAYFKDNQGYKGSHVRVKGDCMFLGDCLWLWVIGSRMSIDGKGFQARAKVRAIYSPEADSTKEQPIGLYIDKVYGDYSLLMSRVEELYSWWTAKSREMGWEVTPLLGLGGWWEGYSPSSHAGCQDTISPLQANFGVLKTFHMDKVFSNRGAQMTRTKYSGREKYHKVYENPLAAARYNSQNNTWDGPSSYDRAGKLCPMLRYWTNWLRNEYGNPTGGFYRKEWYDPIVGKHLFRVCYAQRGKWIDFLLEYTGGEDTSYQVTLYGGGRLVTRRWVNGKELLSPKQKAIRKLRQWWDFMNRPL